MIEPGIYKDLSSDEYHGDTNSISRSALMTYAKSPFHYWAEYINPERPPKLTKKSWTLGSAFHTMILEPNKFDLEYAPKPPRVLLKDVGRVAYEKYKKAVEEIESSNRHILSDEEYLTLLGMKKSLYAHRKAHDLILAGVYESSYFWRDDDSGMMIKSRPDILQDDIYIDLKTMSDVSPEHYTREMIKFGYHTQAAMVRDALRNLENKELRYAINIGIETSYPYKVNIFIIDEAAIDNAEEKYKSLLVDLSSDIVNNTWHNEEAQLIGLPKWSM